MTVTMLASDKSGSHCMFFPLGTESADGHRLDFAPFDFSAVTLQSCCGTDTNTLSLDFETFMSTLFKLQSGR